MLWCRINDNLSEQVMSLLRQTICEIGMNLKLHICAAHTVHPSWGGPASSKGVPICARIGFKSGSVAQASALLVHLGVALTYLTTFKGQ